MKGFTFIRFALRSCYPGVIIEELAIHDMEVRVLSIFGEVVAGATDSGERWSREEMISKREQKITLHDKYIMRRKFLTRDEVSRF